MKTERIIVSNHENGPWKQSSKFRRLQDAAKEYFSMSMPMTSFTWVCILTYIVVDLWRGQILSVVAIPQHHDFVWRKLPDLECFSRVGESTKGGRWYARAVALRHFIGVVHQYGRRSIARRVPRRRFHR